MIFGWLRRRRRRELLAPPFPDTWRAVLEDRLAFHRSLDDASRARLHDDLRILLAEKHWEGCAGVDLTDEMKLLIAATASLLVLGLDVDRLERAESILVYPDTFVAPDHEVVGGEVVHEFESERLGEAWGRGPIVLSWKEIEADLAAPDDGRNLILHEFAHELEPPAPPAAWREVFQAEYDALCDAVDDGRDTLLDEYGATDEHEFFAVATECFFEQPRDMQAELPDLYGILRDFYRQDPATRPVVSKKAAKKKRR